MAEKAESKATESQPKRLFSAEQKCRAVLSVWSEHRKPSEVCRDLAVKWMVLKQWQDRALEGMLQALEPRVALDRGPALSPRLQTLLDKRMKKATMQHALPNQLEQRLAKIQQGQQTQRPSRPQKKK